MNLQKKKLLLIILLIALFFLWAFIKPNSYEILLLDIVPVIVGIIVLAVTYKRFPFTIFAYSLIAFEIMVALYGAHYSYTSVPIFEWLKETGMFARNNYDKFGHFIQGFVPAIIVREILLRTTPLKKNLVFNLLVLSVCLAISGLYEILEFLAALKLGDEANDFLGTQGYMWDTQTDMMWALIGAITSLLLLSDAHDKALKEHQN